MKLTGMLESSLSCWFKPFVTPTFEKLFTPDPPAHVQFVFHAIVDPLKLTTCEHWDPAVAPDSPQRSRNIS